MEKIKFTSDTESLCQFCGSEVRLVHEEISNRWRDRSIPDEDLSFIEMIHRQNNEAPMLVTCPKCNRSWEEL